MSTFEVDGYSDIAIQMSDGYNFTINAGTGTVGLASGGTTVFSAHGAAPTINQSLTMVGQSTVGTAGAISTYMTITVNGIAFKIALYSP
jgi:hypothetical protein